MKRELNALFRRAWLVRPEVLRKPQNALGEELALSSAQMGHVIAMVRHALKNLDKPLKNGDITAVTGLHENCAPGLITQIMQMPLKQFVLRMRLMRTRALLMESKLAIASVAEASGFTSISQFHAQFKSAYGTSPHAVRQQYLARGGAPCPASCGAGRVPPGHALIVAAMRQFRFQVT